MLEGKETAYVKISSLDNELANYLIGKLATLADASIENERQAKAFKDVLKGIIWGVESERSVATGRILYSCQRDGLPMLPDWLKKEISVGSRS